MDPPRSAPASPSQSVAAERTFEARPGEVGEARRYVSRYTAGLAEAAREAVLLLVSELATNSVVHARSEFTIAISPSTDGIRVEVRDRGPGMPVARRGSGSRGRGLLLVDRIADDWGVEPAPGGQGKTVWFSVATPVPTAAG